MKLNFLIWGIRCFSLQECPFLSSFQLVFLSDFRKNIFCISRGRFIPRNGSVSLFKKRIPIIFFALFSVLGVWRGYFSLLPLAGIKGKQHFQKMLYQNK